MIRIPASRAFFRQGLWCWRCYWLRKKSPGSGNPAKAELFESGNAPRSYARIRLSVGFYLVVMSRGNEEFRILKEDLAFTLIFFRTLRRDYWKKKELRSYSDAHRFCTEFFPWYNTSIITWNI
jgi:hypothetical protein